MAFTLQYLRPYAARLAAYGLCVLLSVVFTMATALSVADFLKILFPTEGADTMNVSMATGGNLLAQGLQSVYLWLASFGPQRALLYFSLLFFGLYALKNVWGYLSALFMASIRIHVVHDIRGQLFSKALRLPLSYYSVQQRGDMLSHFAGDLTEYDESTLGSLQQLAASIISLLLYTAMLLYISPRLTLLVVVALPFILFVISGISHRLRRNSAQLQTMGASLMSQMEETIVGLKVIKSYTAIDFSNSRFRQSDSRYAALRTRVFRRVDMASPVSDFLGNCVVVGILLVGSLMVLQGNSGITPDLFVSYIMMFVLMIPPTKELTTALSQMKKGRACVERLTQFLSNAEEQPDAPDAVPFQGLQQQVEFRNVSFSYQPGVEVLHQVSFTIPRGQTVALVGSSGSGKSTLADLLMHFHDCTNGEILLDGQPLRHYTTSSLRRHIGVVAQQTFLFNDTVRANIAFARPDATDSQIAHAAHISGVDTFVPTLPQGYDTPIGDSGALLSGGQRQRISIARAVLGSPDLLILDEATSALDTESERQVQQSLDTLLSGRTALIIAHRLSTVRHAHRILVLEEGRIVESGTHDELMALNGRYCQLHNT